MHNDSRGDECKLYDQNTVRQRHRPWNFSTIVFLNGNDNSVDDNERMERYYRQREYDLRMYIKEIQYERQKRIDCMNTYHQQMLNTSNEESFRNCEIKYIYLEKFIDNLNERERKLSNELNDIIKKNTMCTS